MSTGTDGRRGVVQRFSHAADTHAGLWLDRYLPALRQHKGGEQEGGRAGEALRRLLDEAADTRAPLDYASAEARRRKLLASTNGDVEGGVTEMFVAEAVGRIVIGLGAASLRETNVSLVHTWGVPFLPGSALKGLATAAAHQLGEEAATENPSEASAHVEEHAVLFGTTGQAGYVVFHDAWWLPDCKDSKLPLELDVMTVHHPDYYGGQNNAPPADWDEPIPVPFLTTAGRYTVALSGPQAWVSRASELLEFGLRNLGIGAKTSAGYGRMSLVRQPSARERERAVKLEQHKTVLGQLRRLPAQHKGAPTAKQHVQMLRTAIEQGAPPSEVYVVARELYCRDPRFWDGWFRDRRRTEEERAFLVESSMRPGGQST